MMLLLLEKAEKPHCTSWYTHVPSVLLEIDPSIEPFRYFGFRSRCVATCACCVFINMFKRLRSDNPEVDPLSPIQNAHTSPVELHFIKKKILRAFLRVFLATAIEYQ